MICRSISYYFIHYYLHTFDHIHGLKWSENYRGSIIFILFAIDYMEGVLTNRAWRRVTPTGCKTLGKKCVIVMRPNKSIGKSGERVVPLNMYQHHDVKLFVRRGWGNMTTICDSSSSASKRCLDQTWQCRFLHVVLAVAAVSLPFDGIRTIGKQTNLQITKVQHEEIELNLECEYGAYCRKSENI